MDSGASVDMSGLHDVDIADRTSSYSVVLGLFVVVR
jgi:hypothetical protein